LKHLTDAAIARLITPKTALQLAEKAFRAWGERRVQMPAKVYLTLPEGDFRAMPAYIRSGGGGIVGVKWISVYPGNIAKGLPAVNGTLLLSDANNGRLKAVMDANVLTALRTGAAGALATRLLSRPDADRLLLVGAGVQSIYQIHCHLRLRRWASIQVWAPDPEQSRRFIQRLKPALRRQVTPADTLSEAAAQADVICTCTPSRKPLIKSAWVRPGTHINAIGADAPGKQELDIALLKRSRLFVDDWTQASHSGEINVAHSRGTIGPRDVESDLGTVLVRRARFRRKAGDITVFDSTGLAVQDMMMADHAAQYA
jgi:alanine dehydrogenase